MKKKKLEFQWAKNLPDLSTVPRKRQRSKRLKIFALQYSGGRCCVCGYDKCMRALSFHHVDPKQKDFSISDDYVSSHQKTLEEIITELDKCILVCHNCHSEIHDGIYDESPGIIKKSKLKLFIRNMKNNSKLCEIDENNREWLRIKFSNNTSDRVGWKAPK